MRADFRPVDESERLACLDNYCLIGSHPEPAYDRLVALGCRLFGAPSCIIAVTGETAHWLKARHGISQVSLDRNGSFLCETLIAPEPFVVLDARKDQRFAADPLAFGPDQICFFAGAPLINSEGIRIGVLCLLDSEPRPAFDEADRGLLTELAAIVSERFDQRRSMRRGSILRSFSDISSLAIVTTNDKGLVTFWNGAAERMFGHDRTRMTGRPLDRIMPERFRAAHAAGLGRMSGGGASRLAGKSVEVVGFRADGSEFPMEITISAWDGPIGKEFGAQIQDISERRAREGRLERLAHHDGLTGLPNRNAVRERLEHRLSQKGRVSVIVCDINRFNVVNDTLGHGIGDALLQTVAIRLASCIEQGQLARVGGDVFAVVIERDCGLAEVEALAGTIVDAFDAPIDIAGHRIQVSLSFGIAAAPDHADDADELLARADLAMTQGKLGTKSSVRLFDARTADRLAARRAINEELRCAAIDREWQLFYQPQVRLENRTLVGVEALLRWRHPERGLLPPSEFLSVLETHLAARGVGQWVLEEACRQLAEWRAQGHRVPRVAINLFQAQFRTGTLEADVTVALQRHGLRPGDLELELTETIALDTDRQHHEKLRSLMRSGVGIAFDDFGTGFASLTTLKNLPVSKLKIDKSFVQDVTEAPNSVAIIGAVISIGRSLGIDVIAEGVETDVQRQQLMGLGCRTGQGYLFGKPVPASELPRIARFSA